MLGPVAQALGYIQLRVFNADTANCVVNSYQVNGGPGRSHADFHFRAKGMEFKVFTQGAGNIRIPFVAAIKADILAQ